MQPNMLYLRMLTYMNVITMKIRGHKFKGELGGAYARVWKRKGKNGRTVIKL